MDVLLAATVLLMIVALPIIGLAALGWEVWLMVREYREHKQFSNWCREQNIRVIIEWADR